uniref:Putative secreted protein n=1 Tax=Anopheles triannulatus TaxID=58253 RepID=A0A2M4B759_9DIPT
MHTSIRGAFDFAQIIMLATITFPLLSNGHKDGGGSIPSLPCTSPEADRLPFFDCYRLQQLPPEKETKDMEIQSMEAATEWPFLESNHAERDHSKRRSERHRVMQLTLERSAAAPGPQDVRIRSVAYQ